MKPLRMARNLSPKAPKFFLDDLDHVGSFDIVRVLDEAVQLVRIALFPDFDEEVVGILVRLNLPFGGIFPFRTILRSLLDKVNDPIFGMRN